MAAMHLLVKQYEAVYVDSQDKMHRGTCRRAQ
jgi:hypothetical protein